MSLEHRSEARRWSRQIPLIGEQGQARLCGAQLDVADDDGPTSSWTRLYLERAGVKVTPVPRGSAEAPALGPEVIGQGPAIPELLGALAAADALVEILQEVR